MFRCSTRPGCTRRFMVIPTPILLTSMVFPTSCHLPFRRSCPTSSMGIDNLKRSQRRRLITVEASSTGFEYTGWPTTELRTLMASCSAPACVAAGGVSGAGVAIPGGGSDADDEVPEVLTGKGDTGPDRFSERSYSTFLL